MLHDKNRNAIDYRVRAAAVHANQSARLNPQIAVAGGAGKLTEDGWIDTGLCGNHSFCRNNGHGLSRSVITVERREPQSIYSCFAPIQVEITTGTEIPD